MAVIFSRINSQILQSFVALEELREIWVCILLKVLIPMNTPDSLVNTICS